jgi:5-histidylcysteine sulfoxide synthase/putative 4-mercaptohistidine N1-methyltranferase
MEVSGLYEETPQMFERPLDEKFSPSELLVTRTTLLTGDDPDQKRQEIREYFHATFSLYESLFEILRDDSVFYKQPDKLRHPLIFYFGHTACLYINKLKLGRIIQCRVDPKIESTCAVGVDEMSWDDLNEGHYDWPTVARLREYRNQVRRVVDEVIQTLPLTLPITWQSPWWTILLGIEHERIHLETSSVLFRQLALEDVKVHPLFSVCPHARSARASVPANELLDIAGGHVTSGRKFDDLMYGWDVDYGHLEADVKSFKASKFLVSNAEFHEFILDGGYHNEKWWTPEGWSFIQYHKTYRPVFWIPELDEEGKVTGYRYRSMTQEHPMPWDWPVDVNYLEAKAFCNWKSAQTGRHIRLPTEDEWMHFRDVHFPKSSKGDQPLWDKAPGNINLEYWSSASPVDQFEFKGGFFDVIGNVWQHTETPIYALKGYKVHPLYDDFSIPTFDTKHNQIKGGSFISTGNEATRDARFAFRRHFYQHAGFRYVEGEPVDIEEAREAMFEKERDVVDDIEFQYGLKDHSLPVGSYHEQVAQFAVDFMRKEVEYGAAAEAASAERQRKHKFDDHVVSSAVGKRRKKEEVEDVEGKQGEAGGGIAGSREGEAGGGASLRALDLGCGTGRASFELAKFFDEVWGLDRTTRFIRAALQLQGPKDSESSGSIKYAVSKEGDIESFREVRLVDFKLGGAKNKVEFQQQDACNLEGKKFSNFDLVLASNLITELYDPKAFLVDIHNRIRVGGLLVLTSDYKWGSATPKHARLGGYRDEKTSEIVSTFSAIEDILVGQGGGHFVLAGEPKDIPFIRRISARNYEYTVAQCSVWKRVK